MPLALLLLAVALGANVLLGPLGLGLLQWRLSADLLNQTYGADGATLALAVPAALAAAWLWRARWRLAAPLSLGVGLYALYYAVAEVLGPDYQRYAGNNERYFPLFLSIIVLSWTSAARSRSTLDPAPPPPPRALGRGFAIVLLLVGAVIGLTWTAQVLAIAATGRVGQEFTDSPSAFWIVRIVDLGFLVPVALATGIGLWREEAAAIKAAYAVAGFLTMQGAAVVAMGVIMLWRNDPTASPALVLALGPIVLAVGALTGRLMASYAQGGRGSGRRGARATVSATTA